MITITDRKLIFCFSYCQVFSDYKTVFTFVKYVIGNEYCSSFEFTWSLPGGSSFIQNTAKLEWTQILKQW